jgi:hypothetical protein
MYGGVLQARHAVLVAGDRFPLHGERAYLQRIGAASAISGKRPDEGRARACARRRHEQSIVRPQMG